MHNWDFSPVYQYSDAIIDGMVVTLLLTVSSCVVGTALAVPVGIGLKSSNRIVAASVTVLVEMIRALPPLVLLIWFYYLLPVITGVGISPFATAFVVFAISFAAFAADIFRGSIESISKGTKEAAMALGMTKSTFIRRVILQEVFRRSFPSLNSLAVGTLKMSSLASVIAVNELMYSATLILSERPRPFEVYTAIALAYLCLIVPIVFFFLFLERSKWFVFEPHQS